MKFKFSIALFVLIYIAHNANAQSGYYIYASKPNDEIKLYLPTLYYDKDTVLPTIKIYSTKADSVSILIAIHTSDTIIKYPFNTFLCDNSRGSLYSYFIQEKQGYTLVSNISMHYYKIAKKHRILIFHPKPEDPAKKYYLTIPFEIINEE